MHSHVNLSFSSGLLLLSHKAFVLVIQKLNDGVPVVSVVHIVTESRGVDNSQLNLEQLFFELYTKNFDVEYVGVTARLLAVSPPTYQLW